MFLAVLLFSWAVTAQQDNSPELSQKDAPPTFQSKVNLVLVPVVVRNPQGVALGNLNKEDFQLFDKGKPQIISSFSVLKRGTPNAEAQNATPVQATGAPPAAAPPVSPDRYVAYLFDDLNIEFADLVNTKKAASLHLSNALQPNDRAAIYTTSGKSMLDFTDDKTQLHDTLAKIQPQSMFQHVAHQCPDLSYYWADLIVNKNDQQALDAATQETLACANLDPVHQVQTAQQMARSSAQQEMSVGEQGTRVTLGVIKNVIRRMAAKPGQRIIVLASPGFLTPTAEAISDKAAILNAAATANVTISSINARGLFTTELDASQQGAYSIATQQLVSQYTRQSAEATEDVLAELADGTGGTFFHNNNDLNAGFARVAEAPEVSYVLGFSPQVMKPDGSFHRLKVTLVNEKGAALQARRGYYAVKHTRSPEENAKSDIEDAIFARDEMRDIPIDLQTQFFKPDASSAKLTVMAKVDLRRLHFKKVDGRNNDELSVTSVLFDRNGNYITGLTKTVTMKLRDETLARLNSGISVKNNFDVKPGTYVIRLVVRDAEGQAMAAQNGAVEIP